jgi:hypothetical protein
MRYYPAYMSGQQKEAGCYIRLNLLKRLVWQSELDINRL